jgi:hypothetical protein
MKGKRTQLGANQILPFRELVAAILRRCVGDYVGRYATAERVKTETKPVILQGSLSKTFHRQLNILFTLIKFPVINKKTLHEMNYGKKKHASSDSNL